MIVFQHTFTDTQDVQAQFHVLGLAQRAKDDFAPFRPRKNAKPSVFGADMVAATYLNADSVQTVAVYFKNVSDKQLMQKLGVANAETKTGAKTTLVVEGAAELEAESGGDEVIPFRSNVACQLSVK